MDLHNKDSKCAYCRFQYLQIHLMHNFKVPLESVFKMLKASMFEQLGQPEEKPKVLRGKTT